VQLIQHLEHADVRCAAGAAAAEHERESWPMAVGWDYVASFKRRGARSASAQPERQGEGNQAQERVAHSGFTFRTGRPDPLRVRTETNAIVQCVNSSVGGPS